MSDKTCKICNSISSVPQKVSGYSKGSFFNVYKCSNCACSFVESTKMFTDIYQNIYKNARTLPGYNRYFHYMETVKSSSRPWEYLHTQEPMYWAVYKAMSDYTIDKNSKILEVGSGLGYLTYALRKSGYNISGIDISEEAVSEATKTFGNYYIAGDIFDLAMEGKSKYDLIILTEVIEHVENPTAFIDTLLKLLGKGGKLIITTPNKTVDDPNLIWNTELPPVHLWWFSEKSFLTMANMLSCNLNFINFTDYNKGHFDKMRFKIYKSYNYSPVLDEKGEVMNPSIFQPKKSNLKSCIEKILTRLTIWSPINKILTRKEYPRHKSSTLAAVFQVK